MEPVAGAKNFVASGEAYDGFMGRYSRPLAPAFATFAGVSSEQRALDVGCGPGALTGELVARLGTDAVAGCDPSPSFVAACRERYPGVDVRPGSAEQVPFADDTFDVVLSQLVLHFVSDPPAAAAEMRRVLRPGGTLAACVWDFHEGMEMITAFWDAAVSIDPSAPREADKMRFGRPGEISQWLTGAGLDDPVETTIRVSSTYVGFDELWMGLLAGVGPVGSYCVSLPSGDRESLRIALHEHLGAPTGAFSLEAVARVGRATCAAP